jgi:hypothetical protein
MPGTKRTGGIDLEEIQKFAPLAEADLFSGWVWPVGQPEALSGVCRRKGSRGLGKSRAGVGADCLMRFNRNALAILSFHLAMIAVLVVLVYGCGKKMPPIPPDSQVPGTARNFTVQQEGQALLLQWLIPKVNIDGQPLTDIQGFQILRSRQSLFSAATCPPELFPLAKIDLAFPQSGKVQGEQVSYRDDHLEPGYQYFYQILGYDRGDHLGLASPASRMSGISLPQVPADLAKAGDRQVALSWEPGHLLAKWALAQVVTYNV